MGTDVGIIGLTKSFGSQVIWRDVTLTLPAGEICVMLGPSGTGKSVMPIKMKKISNYVATGSIFNQYLCELNLSVNDPNIPPALGAILQGLSAQLAQLPVGGTRCDTAPGEIQ